MWMKNCLNHWKQISKHIFQFYFPFFFLFWTNLSARQYDFHELNFLKGTDNQSWICVGFIMLVSWSRLRVWKQMWIVKTQKDVMVSWKNDLWIMLHHKFICLLCVHHSFFLTSILLLFLLDVTKSSSSFFFCLFQTFWFSWIFLLVNRLSNKSANHQCEVTLVRGNLKKIFALLSLKGVTKVHILCFMIKKHGHTSFPKHDYFLFQEVSTHEENWFMLQVVPYFYSCLFFA